MALPASPNTITLADVQTEFTGGTNPIGLNEYYKGGAYVASGDDAPNVPASSTISLGNFHSAAKSATPLTLVGAAYGYCNNGTVNPTPACTAEAFASATGGNGSGSYWWTYVSGHTGFAISAANADAVSWTHTNDAYNIFTATWNLSDGTSSIDFTVTMEHANNA
jgi:hypothetical protein